MDCNLKCAARRFPLQRISSKAARVPLKPNTCASSRSRTRLRGNWNTRSVSLADWDICLATQRQEWKNTVRKREWLSTDCSNFCEADRYRAKLFQGSESLFLLT